MNIGHSIQGMNVSQALRYMNFWRKADTIFQAHSPLVYDLLSSTLRSEIHPNQLDIPRRYSNTLSKYNQSIEWKDLGAKSRLDGKVSVARRAKYVSTAPQKGRLLLKLMQWRKPQNALELGTAFGQGTSYLYAGYPEAYITTVEGQPTVLEIAQELLSQVSNSIKCQRKDFVDFLSQVDDQAPAYDLVFVDGGHTAKTSHEIWNSLEGKLSDRCMVIWDDIYWSQDMKAFWTQIQRQSTGYYWIDLFHYGIMIKHPNQREKMTQAFVSKWSKPWMLRW